VAAIAGLEIEVALVGAMMNAGATAPLRATEIARVHVIARLAVTGEASVAGVAVTERTPDPRAVATANVTAVGVVAATAAAPGLRVRMADPAAVAPRAQTRRHVSTRVLPGRRRRAGRVVQVAAAIIVSTRAAAVATMPRNPARSRAKSHRRSRQALVTRTRSRKKRRRRSKRAQ
jgi:hypothetical protein